MANRTTHAEQLTRETAAERLEAVAAELRGGDCEVVVGNKTVRLSPPGEVDLDVGVRESSSLFGGPRESLTLTLDWQPAD